MYIYTHNITESRQQRLLSRNCAVTIRYFTQLYVVGLSVYFTVAIIQLSKIPPYGNSAVPTQKLLLADP